MSKDQKPAKGESGSKGESAPKGEAAPKPGATPWAATPPGKGGGAKRDAKLRIAAVADLHVHKAHRGEYREMFAEISGKADVLAMCGDLTNLGLPEEAEHLAADLEALKIPALAVLGNHDHHSGKPEEVRRVLRQANVTFLDEETFVVGDVGFAGVKGFGGGFGRYMLGPFGEEATKHFVTEALGEALALENALHTLMLDRKVVLMHYSPIPETIEGEAPEVQPFLGCSRFSEILDRFELSAVFHGHAHNGVPRGKTPKGNKVYNCSIEVLKRLGGAHYMVVEV